MTDASHGALRFLSLSHSPKNLVTNEDTSHCNRATILA